MPHIPGRDQGQERRKKKKRKGTKRGQVEGLQAETVVALGAGLEAGARLQIEASLALCARVARPGACIAVELARNALAGAGVGRVLVVARTAAGRASTSHEERCGRVASHAVVCRAAIALHAASIAGLADTGIGPLSSRAASHTGACREGVTDSNTSRTLVCVDT